jgi:hypothetical protein
MRFEWCAPTLFFDQQLLGFLEQRGLSYIVVARLTLWLKREAARVTEWRALDQHYTVGEFSLQLLGWDRPRRFVVIREQLRAERASLARKTIRFAEAQSSNRHLGQIGPANLHETDFNFGIQD